MNVLSLFDGMSCGRIALDRAGIEVGTYYASELDKYAITVTAANWPETVQLGDVTKWREWNINWESIDLLIGGSPCQGFSFAGKQLAFDDPRSALFFEYLNILNHIQSVNPNVKFMLENVKMKKEYLEVISSMLKVEPVFINSALVSAQNRQRYYWASWEFEPPEDKGYRLIDILQDDIDIKNVHTNKALDYMNRIVKGGRSHWDFKHHSDSKNNKASCITANHHKGVPYNVLVDRTKAYSLTSSYCNGVDAKQYFEQKRKQVVFIEQTGRGNNHGGPRALDGKTPTLTSNSWEHNNHLVESGEEILCRKLTPIECERLQTVPDNYTNHVSNTQRYKMLGNGWTCNVVAHIFKGLQP